jgi:hypothetical protein
METCLRLLNRLIYPLVVDFEVCWADSENEGADVKFL